MKNNLKKFVSFILAATMVFSLSACNKKAKDDGTDTEQKTDTKPAQVSYDKASESYNKSETVYVNMDSQGEVTSKIVTDWLHTDTAETYIDDKSDLINIINVKDDVQPVKNNDGTIRWNMKTTDLYYRGETSATPPVNFKITYYLDGKETTSEKIAGKSGQVKIVVTVSNTSKQDVTIGGKKSTIYTPFIVAGGMILGENEFSNISVENGKTIGDGTKEIALMVGVPGLKESLNLDDDILKELGDFDFSDTYTITADTDCFEISNMMFAVIPLSAIESELGNTLPDTLTEVKSILSKVQTIIDKFNNMNATELINNLFSNTDKITELTDSISDVTTLYNDNKALIDVIEKYMTTENINALKKLIDDTDDIDIEAVVKLLSNPILQKFFKELPTLSNDMQSVMPIITGLSTDLSDPEVKKALDNLPKTLETIKKLKSTLDDNQELFDTLGETLDKDTINSIKDIMSSLDGMISNDMIEKYASLADNADELIERAKSWITAGTSYNLFTKATDKATTSVIFVYETAPISAPEEKEVVTDDAESGENPILVWFKNLFKSDKKSK